MWAAGWVFCHGKTSLHPHLGWVGETESAYPLWWMKEEVSNKKIYCVYSIQSSLMSSLDSMQWECMCPTGTNRQGYRFPAVPTWLCDRVSFCWLCVLKGLTAGLGGAKGAFSVRQETERLLLSEVPYYWIGFAVSPASSEWKWLQISFLREKCLLSHQTGYIPLLLAYLTIAFISRSLSQDSCLNN